MQREAPQTLFTLSSQYQNVSADLYEVIAVDNGSSHPLDSEWVKSFGTNFHYYNYKTNSISPCEAMNLGIQKAQAQHIMCLIDGARMLSPGILQKTLDCIKLFNNPFIYTLNLHLGEWHQNLAYLTQYDKTKEDQLLNSINWKENGYQLFTISNFRTEQFNFFTCLFESNCFTVLKEELVKIGGFDERFVSPGGGLVNRHVFMKFIENPKIQVISLLGEASFHQTHGGITSNQPFSEEKKNLFNDEYKKITNRIREIPSYQPFYFGNIPNEAMSSQLEPLSQFYLIKGKELLQKKQLNSAFYLFENAQKEFPYNWRIINELAICCRKRKDEKNELHYRKKAVKVNPLNVNLLLALGKSYLHYQKWEEAVECLAVVKEKSKNKAIPSYLIYEASLNGEENYLIETYWLETIGQIKTEQELVFILRRLYSTKQFEKLKFLVSKVEPLFENHASFYFWKAKSLIRRSINKNSEEINNCLIKAIELSDKPVLNYYCLFISFLQDTGQTKYAQVIEKKALKYFSRRDLDLE